MSSQPCWTGSPRLRTAGSSPFTLRWKRSCSLARASASTRVTGNLASSPISLQEMESKNINISSCVHAVSDGERRRLGRPYIVYIHERTKPVLTANKVAAKPAESGNVTTQVAAMRLSIPH